MPAISRLGAALLLLAAASAEAQITRYSIGNLTEVRSIVFTAADVWAGTSDGILRLGSDGSVVTVVPDSVLRIVLGPDGALWAATSDQLIRVDPSTGATQRFDLNLEIVSLAYTGDGTLWLLTRNPFAVVRVDTSGQIVSNNPTAQLPSFLFVRPVEGGGAVWFLSSTSLTRLTSTGATQTFPLPLSYPSWLAEGDGFLWVVEDVSQMSPVPRAARISFTGEVQAVYPLPPNTVAYGVTADDAGNLLFTSETDGHVLLMTPDGDVTRLAPLPRERSNCLEAPDAIAAAPDGRIAVARQWMLSAVSPPNDPCRNDPASESVILVFNASHLAEIPTLGTSALLLLAALVAAIAAQRLVR